MKPNLYQEKHRIMYYETDMTSRLSLGMLLNLAVLVSEDQIDHLHVGTQLLQGDHIGWVVIQYSIHVNRLPKNNEVVTLSTQSKYYNQFLAEREFLIKDASGKVCAKIDSNWILLNLRTRKLILIKPDLIKPYGAQLVPVLPHLRRPYPIKNQHDTVSRIYRVRYSDIDINHHVNNAKYLNWMCDVLKPDFLVQHVPQDINIKFSHEVKYGTNVTSRVKMIKQDSNTVFTRHEITSNHQISAVANVKWIHKN
ncbi:acyl-ACP thioesterase [uncultured bacterium]|uniref:acyl-[acyl-carrier-protein] thioesterase n=1 Tax=Acetilactobacillus jinshanensis TaxID=1720083 RepID=UPI002188C3C6|nr:acyl-ACP thioesterase [uncultured bacterium]